MPSRRRLPAGLRDHPLPHGHRSEQPGLEVFSQPGKNPPLRRRRRAGCSPRPPPPTGSSVTPHPGPCHARTAGSPTRLNRSSNRRPGSSVAHWCSLVWIPSTRASASSRRATDRRYSPAISWHPIPAANSLPPFAMWPAFPASDYYGGSAPPRAISRRGPARPRPWQAGGEGSPRTVPTFTMHRSTGSVPSFSPAASPRVRRRLSLVASLPADSPAAESPPPGDGVHCCPARIHQVGAGSP